MNTHTHTHRVCVCVCVSACVCVCVCVCLLSCKNVCIQINKNVFVNHKNTLNMFFFIDIRLPIYFFVTAIDLSQPTLKESKLFAA